MYIHTFLLRMTDTVTSQNIDISSWDILYIGNKSFERVQHFKYFGTYLMNQNSVREEIKCRLQSGNACYYSLQNLLCSSLLSKNIEL